MSLSEIILFESYKMAPISHFWRGKKCFKVALRLWNIVFDALTFTYKILMAIRNTTVFVILKQAILTLRKVVFIDILLLYARLPVFGISSFLYFSILFLYWNFTRICTMQVQNNMFCRQDIVNFSNGWHWLILWCFMPYDERFLIMKAIF